MVCVTLCHTTGLCRKELSLFIFTLFLAFVSLCVYDPNGDTCIFAAGAIMGRVYRLCCRQLGSVQFVLLMRPLFLSRQS